MANRQTAIGAFVLGGAILAVGVLMTFGHFRFFSHTIRAALVFQGSISGLAVGAPVTFRGVRVGAVKTISISYDRQEHAAYIPVIIDLDPDRVIIVQPGEDHSPLNLGRLIESGLRAQLNMQSFVTGQSNVNLDFDPATVAILHPRITDMTEIPVKPSAIQRVKEELGELPLKQLAANANTVMESVRDLAQRLDRDLPPLISSLQASSEHSRKTVDTVTDAVTGLQKSLSVTLDNLNTLLISGHQQIAARGADAQAALQNVTKTAQQATLTLSSIRGMLAPRAENRANLDAALRDIAAAAAALRGFASDVERNPQLLLTGRKP